MTEEQKTKCSDENQLKISLCHWEMVRLSIFDSQSKFLILLFITWCLMKTRIFSSQKGVGNKLKKSRRKLIISLSIMITSIMHHLFCLNFANRNKRKRRFQSNLRVLTTKSLGYRDLEYMANISCKKILFLKLKIKKKNIGPCCPRDSNSQPVVNTP